VLSRRFRTEGNGGWATYSLLIGAVGLLSYALAVAGPSGVDALPPVAGILQRISIVVGLGWVGQVALRLWRTSAEAVAAG